MPLSDLIALATAQHWLPLILMLTVIVRRWTAPDSKFPINVAPQWRPVVTAAGGLVYGLVSAIQQGMSPLDATLAMAAAMGAGGFFDGLLIAIFNKDNAPKWAKWVVFIFDDLTGGGPTPPAAKAASVLGEKAEPPQAPVSIKPSAPTTPPAARDIYTSAEYKKKTPGLWRLALRWNSAPLVGVFAFILMASAVAATAVVTDGCTAAQWTNFSNVSMTIATYVLTFIQAAESAWALILPQLGAQAAQLDARFQHAVAGLQKVVAAMQDAVHAADLAQQSTLDLTAFVTAVKNAAADVQAVVVEAKALLGAKAQLLGTHFDDLDAMAKSIAAWRVK